ncbi:MAG: ArsR/SmtB family transcription factor [Panacagrimonas sp.]
MVDKETTELDRTFRALADPTRRAMLRRLSQGECTVSTLAQPHDMSLAAISKHVKALERAGLIRQRIEGRERYCQLQTAKLSAAMEWLRYYEQFWNERLQALDDFFGKPT